MMVQTLEERQKDICSRYGAAHFGCDLALKIGISRNVRDGAQPLNGLRIKPEHGTSGWYIWGGEKWSDDPEFFVPLHGKHLADWAPSVLPYLGLPPGWRFLIAEGHEDVWEDPEFRG